MWWGFLLSQLYLILIVVSWVSLCLEVERKLALTFVSPKVYWGQNVVSHSREHFRGIDL